jgi:hypothetical protein
VPFNLIVIGVIDLNALAASTDIACAKADPRNAAYP